MNDKEFFDFCYDQYKTELADADLLYQRAGILLTGLAVLGGLIAALIRLEYVVDTFHRLDIGAYYICAAASVLSLTCSAGFLVAVLIPRRYSRIAPVKAWKEWRAVYGSILTSDDVTAEERNREALAIETHTLLLDNIAKAQSENAPQNQARMKHFTSSVKWTSIAVVCMVLLALARLAIYVRGV